MSKFNALKEKSETFQGLETFDAPKHCTEVLFETKEIYSNCPVTGQPDFSSVVIKFIPDKLCVESKSLKLYLHSFANQGIFGEFLAEKIAQDIMEAVQALSVTVTLIQGIRGGIQMTATSTVVKDVL